MYIALSAQNTNNIKLEEGYVNFPLDSIFLLFNASKRCLFRRKENMSNVECEESLQVPNERTFFI